MRGAQAKRRAHGRAGVALGALGACAVAWCSWPAEPAAAGARREGRETHARASAGEDFHWSWHIAAGKAIEIKGVNGDIHARAASGGEVEVTATKHARRSDPEQVKIEVIEREGGVTVCAVYPGRWGKPNECEPGERTHSHVDDNDVVVDFEVRVPAGVRFVGRTVNGGIEAEGLHGPVEANTVNGSIGLSTGGTARASTVNGSIVASVGSASWKGDLGFRTVNGGIELDFPRALSTEVDAETLNGDITSDFPLTIMGRVSKRHVSGTVGSGGGGLLLSTVNGDIRLSSSR